MDKYEYKVRADEIKSLIAEGEYAEAVKIADTIDWQRVKSVMMLCTISDLYKINRRYEESRDILLLAHERHTGGRLIVYSLCELSLKLEEYVQAIEYYKEFVQIAPKDSGRYILQYKLYEAQDVSLEERIAVLEELKKKDYREKWAYELAYLYHRVGLGTKCVEECDEMYLWFAEGRYVIKALELKKLHEPLTAEQEEKLLQMTGSDYAIENTGNIAIKQEASEVTEEDGEFMPDEESEAAGETVQKPEGDMDIQVKTVDVSEYNTINLQKELAESMKEFLGDSDGAFPKPSSSYAIKEAVNQQKALLRQDTDEIKMISDEDFTEIQTPVLEKDVSREVFFGNTAEIAPMPNIVAPAQKELTPASMSALTNTGIIGTFVKPSGYDDILSQEYDGQISLVVPESEQLEKQITGQISIEDVMNEWERMKKENEAKRMEDVRKRVHMQTDTLLADFDESTKSGVLEQLEKVMLNAVIKEEEQKAAMSRPKVVKISDIATPVSEAVKVPVVPTDEDIDRIVADAMAEDDAEKKKKAAETEEVISDESKITDKNEIVDNNEETDKETDKETEEKDTEVQEETPEVIAAEEPDPTTEEENVIIIPEVEKETGDIDEAAVDHMADSIASSIQDREASKKTEEASSEEPSKKKTAGDFIERLKHPDPEKDKYKCRELTDSEKEDFGPYIHHKRTKKQIVDTLDNISMAAYTGNVIITGEEGTGTVTLAKLLVREIQTTDSNFSGKVAKISAKNLNRKNVTDMLSKLSNGALIIEDASDLSEESVGKLVKGLEKENSGIIVIMEDTKENINNFVQTYDSLISLFNLRVDVEALDDQTLVRYAKQYAEEMEYSIDNLGILALHTRIADMQTSDHEVTISEVEEIVEEAIYYADKKTPKHFLDILVGKRYDEDDMIILRERDFMHY